MSDQGHQTFTTDSPIMVTICCMTYNQEQYIGQCLDSLLAQETSFSFDILVHEDASTDGTAAVVRDYARRYPDKIRTIFQTENQYRQKSITKFFLLPNVKGKYIALCEGDDYWTDPHKLARQVAYLEKNDDCALLTENGTILYTDTGETKTFSQEAERDFSIDDMLLERRFPTASVIYRSRDKEAILQIKKGSFDTAMWCALAQRGRVHFLPNISSVYRRGSGITTGDPVRWAKQVLHFDEIIKANFKVSKSTKLARERDIFWCLWQAARSSFTKGHYGTFIKYCWLAFWHSPLSAARAFLNKL